MNRRGTKISRLMAALLCLGAVIGWIITAGCMHSDALALKRQALMIKNSDIDWDGTTLGLNPTVKGASKVILDNRYAGVIAPLLDSLRDENRFIAAHVLLTFMTGSEFPMSSNAWNGLVVEIRADNTEHIPSGQQDRLIRYWQERTVDQGKHLRFVD